MRFHLKRLISIFLFWFAVWAANCQPILRNFFTTNQNPQVNFTNGNLVSTNIYVSNLFATNITVNNFTNNFEITTNLTVVNEFRGRTEIVTNQFVTNSTVQFLTNNYFYTTNVTEQFVTNNLSYITNLYGPFITNDITYSTNIYVTNLTANYITNNTSYITNLITSNAYFTNIVASNAYITNLFVDNIVTNNFVTNLTVNNLTVNTNAYISNAYITNLNVAFTTNNTFITTNAFISNAYVTNMTVDFVTNLTQVTSNAYVTNLFTSNIFTTNITLMAAIWSTNGWNGPSNNVSFLSTYQHYVPSNSASMMINGLVDASCTNANTTILDIAPTAGVSTIYFPATWTNYTRDHANSYTVAATNRALITLFQFGCLDTNVMVAIWNVDPSTTTTSQLWLTNAADGSITNVNGGPVKVTTTGGIFLQDTLQLNAGDIYLLGGAVQVDSGDSYKIASRIRLTSTASGVAQLYDQSTFNSFTGIIFGPVSNTWPTLLTSTNASGARIGTTAGLDLTGSNYISLNYTTSTNQNQIKPDFSVAEQLISTNAAFTFLAPVGVQLGANVVQWSLVNVTNTTASAVAITSPANCHTVGTAYVTNWTAVWFQCYGGKITNAYYIPVF